MSRENLKEKTELARENVKEKAGLAKDSVKERGGQAIGLAKTETARNSFILFGGNFINALLSMVAVIIVSRALGPHDFGVVAIFNTILGTMVGLTELGLSTAAVKLISENLVNDRHHANVIMRVIFFLELGTGAVVALLGLLFSAPIANALGGPHLLFAVRMGFVAGAVTSAAAFFGPFFAAHKQFVKNALVNFSGSIFKTGAVLAMVAFSFLSLRHVIVAYTLTPILFFSIAYMFVPKGFHAKGTKQEEKEAVVEIFHFSKWIFLSYISTSVGGNMDTFLIAHYKGSAAVGIYTAGQQLVSVMPMIIGAITTVILPKLTGLQTRAEYEKFLTKLIIGISGIALVLSPGIIFGQIPIKLIFGSRFLESISIFKIFLGAYLIILFPNIISVVLYARNRHRLITYINYASLTASLVAYVLLIPRFGAIGAATTFLIVNLISGIFMILFSFKSVRDMPA